MTSTLTPIGLPTDVGDALDLGRDVDERGARRDLRAQIARLEKALGRIRSESFPRRGFDLRAPGGVAEPGRMLGLADLERIRDRMFEALAIGRAELETRHLLEHDFRELIEEMESNPAAHKWERVSNLDIGEPGCKHWHSRPRWGPLGALMGWWRVKVSSGCPLATGAAAMPSRDPLTIAPEPDGEILEEAQEAAPPTV